MPGDEDYQKAQGHFPRKNCLGHVRQECGNRVAHFFRAAIFSRSITRAIVTKNDGETYN